jgi:site-specific DNA recombinase
MKAATYCRVSTDEQAEAGTSLETQRQRTREYVEANGWTLVEEFVDEGVSGAKDSRPQLDALRAACARDEVKVIVVTKHDRLSRSLLGALTLMGDFDRMGVHVEFTDEPNEKGLIRNLRFAIAEDERERIRERTTSGRRARAREGVWVGGKPPFGFAVGEDGRLAHASEDVETLRRAYTLVTSNTPVPEVASILNREGHLPRQENPHLIHEPVWDVNKLRYALTRETLIGKHVYGKTSDVQIETEIPPILTDDEWSRLQAILFATRKQTTRRAKVFPLSSRLVSPCGLTYSGTYDASLDRRYYRCKGRESAPYCSCRRIPAREVEDQVFEEVLSFLDDPERLLRVTGLDREETREEQRESVRALDTRIANLLRAITDKAADALEAGINPTLIAAAVEKLERDRDALVERRARMVEHEERKRERADRRARLSLLARASLTLVNATLDQKRTLFALLDVKASVTENGLEIEGILREDMPQILGVDQQSIK